MAHPVWLDHSVATPLPIATLGLAVVSAIFTCSGAHWALYFGEELTDAPRRIGPLVTWIGRSAALVIAVPLILVVLSAPDLPGILGSDTPPSLWAVIDEAALHRSVGGPEIMRTQLAALAERSRIGNVTLQVIPYQTGAHPGVNSSFIILHLEEVQDVVYVEGLIGNFYLQSPNDVSRYRRTFDQLRALALGPQDSRALIHSVAERLGA